MQRICVYCGSSPGASPIYAEAARGLADALHERDLELVFGGSSKGIMGVVADRMVELGSKVIGVLPKSLMHKEIAHDGLEDLHVVENMHERKAMMVDLADGFIALPGGCGTLEEIIETFTWAQLSFHSKPCGLLNVDGYFDSLVDFLDNATEQGFIKDVHRNILQVDNNPTRLLEKFEEYEAPIVPKWVD